MLLKRITLLASVASSSPVQLGTPFDRRQVLPTVELPYGTWRASRYDSANDIYTFKNIRFAATPTGDLRFTAPAPPQPNSTIQDGSYGFSCISSSTRRLGGSTNGPSRLGGLTGVPRVVPQGEDCLFLDVYAPSRALNGTEKFSVVFWIYGGAYVGGSKDGIYDGTPLIKSAGGNLVFVAANYRLAAYGFLGGSTMERDGTPNAGFYDQQFALQWVQDHISKFGGDPNNVSVWGESAGGGSIMHQLTANGGNGKALFKRAVIQSPAFQTLHDRQGQIETTYKAFEEAAGCAGRGLTCLRNANTSTINSAQSIVMQNAVEGTFGFGPVADGKFVRQLPALELASGNFFKDMESLIVSHVFDEASMFVPAGISQDRDIDTFLTSVFPGLDIIRDVVLRRYPPSGSAGVGYPDARGRIQALIRDSTFVCNVRFISAAYACQNCTTPSSSVYNVQYSRSPGTHGSDVLATFFNPSGELSRLSTLDPSLASFAASYQSYLTSHAMTGDPNTYRLPNSTASWPEVTVEPTLRNVLDAGNPGFSLISDNQTTADVCDFWLDIQAAMTSLGGYAPPDSVVENPFTNIISVADASANFVIV
ncbi:alpha/beta-hydrolase [Eremomyces bilateralis CBS 781.70]|uniref:Carboxylic ester hydrolase n=1 Tax=Eremomyces bilateralis CBS 781.70 TaxID=1392243 RepID=A0A6G1FQY3_9PEZI|nr:alpha/beta-hydrolase [Eremomyces bilateralis CBS 781.70]KAF1808072.1 alpha/beta-hydrolase [Eremomyces bilateralis CBS 781.70]